MSWWNQIKTFLAEVRSEIRKVTFPGRDEVVSTTIVVLVTSVIFAAFLWLADTVVVFCYQGVLQVFKS